MGEHSIVAARASVLIYDDGNARWVASGSSQGLSKVHIYHHTTNGTFRVVGRKLQDHEVVINCAILKGLKYNQATATFHQWRDNRQVYGLNFTSREDADSFAHAMLTALDTLNSGGARPSPQVAAPVITQSHYQMPNMPQMAPQGNSMQPNGPDSEDIEKMSQLVREPYQTHQRSSSKGNSQTVYMGSGTWTVDQPNQDQVTLSSSQTPPQAPPMKTPTSGGVPPPAPPPPPSSSGAGVPPAPPPPPSAAGMGDVGKPPVAPSTMINDGTLAAALKTATLRKTSKAAAPDDDAANTGTLGRSGVPSFPGSGDMMTEMAQKLRQRRQRVEEGDSPGNGGTASTTASGTGGDSPRKPWEKGSQNNQNNSSTSNNGNGAAATAAAKSNGAESPRLSRSKRFQSLTGQENFSQFAANSSPQSADLEMFKLEIISEMKRELQRAKQEIIEAVRQELNRQ